MNRTMVLAVCSYQCVMVIRKPVSIERTGSLQSGDHHTLYIEKKIFLFKPILSGQKVGRGQDEDLLKIVFSPLLDGKFNFVIIIE